MARIKGLDDLLRALHEASEDGAEVRIVNADDIPRGADEPCPGCGEVHGPDHSHKQDSSLVSSDAEAAHALLDVVAVHTNPPIFLPGTFVRYRADNKYVRDGAALHVVLNVLAEPIRVPVTHENEGNNTNYRVYNCVVGKYSKVAGVVKHIADSRELELYPNADKLMRKTS